MILLDEMASYKARYEGIASVGMRVTAELRGPLPVGAYMPPHLSGLLAWAVVTEATEGRGVPTPEGSEGYDIPLPLTCLWRDEGGYPFWAASAMTPMGESVRDVVYLHKRAQGGGWTLSPKGWRVNTSAGRYMERRVPAPVEVAGAWTGYAHGDPVEAARLLKSVTHLGRKRSIGWGEIHAWRVEPCEMEAWDAVTREGVLLCDTPQGCGVEGAEEPRLLGWTPPHWKPGLWRMGWPCGTKASPRR